MNNRFWMLYTPVMLIIALILKLNGNTLMGWELFILLGILFPIQLHLVIQPDQLTFSPRSLIHSPYPLTTPLRTSSHRVYWII